MGFSKFFRRSRWDDERARELDAHLAIEIDENLARGMTPSDARAAARRKLGNTTIVREEIYRMNTIGVLDSLFQDFRYGARLLRLNPSFAIVAILSLALGVGANTAIFQLLNAVRLRTLPVPHPEQLAEVHTIDAGPDSSKNGSFTGRHPELTNPLWERIRDRQEAFSDLFAWSNTNFELSAGGESREAQGLWVSGGFFTTLQVRPVAGRLIATADDRRGCATPPAVISHGFWQREFGGSPTVVGRTIVLDGHQYNVVGVTPPDFFGVEVGQSFDVAVPLCAEPLSRTQSALDRPDSWFLDVIGRLKPGWSLEGATAHLTALSGAMFRETLPKYRAEDERAYLNFKLGAFPAATGVSNLRERYEPVLWLLLATTALVLLIACTNLANLMLARATAREREIAVRLALGAPRSRIVRQLLAESALIAAAGAAGGAFLSFSVSRLLIAALATETQRVSLEVAGDWRVFMFVAAVGAAACAIFGLVPAVRATASTPGAAMKAGSRGSSDTRERFGLRRALVVAQVAVSLVLVVSALLFVRSFRNLATVDAGFTRQHLLIAAFDVRRARMPEEQLRSAYAQLLERVRSEPGVEDAAFVRIVPIGGAFSNGTIVVDGVPRKENVNFNSVSDGYFRTIGTPLLAGRDLEPRDSKDAPRVAIVNESFARVFFAGQNPVGRTFQIEDAPGVAQPSYEIVGLVRDTKYEQLRDRFEPLAALPAAQDRRPVASARLIARSRLPVASLTSVVAAHARELHPATVVRFRTMESQVSDSLVRERLMAALSGGFGALAALIATIGLYGVMSYMVERRRKEIGVRMALGADRALVVRMIMREAGSLLAVGLVVGVVASLAAGRSVSSLLFGLPPHDPATLAAAAAALAAVAAFASYVPALRASRLEPTEALRDE